MMDRLRRIPPWVWALLFSVALCLPRLGGFGFWDPSELKIADQAREIERSGHLLDPTVAGHYPAAKPLGPFLAAVGIKIFGARELGARLPSALMALLTLMAVYWAGAGIFRRRAGLLSTLALGSMTMFVLEARQLTSDAPVMAAMALSIGGLGRYAWPESGQRRLVDLMIGLAGMALAFTGEGALISIVLPGASLFGALAVGYGLTASTGTPADGSGSLAAAGVGPQIPAGRKIGSTAWPLMIGLGLVAVVFLIISMTGVVAGQYSSLLGGAARGGTPTHSFEYLIRAARLRPLPVERRRGLRARAPAHPPRRRRGRRRRRSAAHQQPAGVRPALRLLRRRARLRAVGVSRAGAGRRALHRAARDRARDRRVPRRGDRGQPLRAGRRAADRDRYAGGRARLLPHARGAGIAAPGRQGALAGADRDRQPHPGAGGADRRRRLRWAGGARARRSASCRRTTSANLPARSGSGSTA